jgi:hypothetical protein
MVMMPDAGCAFWKKTMSIFSWFSNKKVESQTISPDSSGLGHVDATVPVAPSERVRTKLAQPLANHGANRKTERLERRELVYAVVRDSMTRAGVLAASFKFKVLSLDVGGYQYLIMVDLAHKAAGDTARLAEIEAMVAQAAKMRHGILVTAVYWRVNEHVTAGLSSVQPATNAQGMQGSFRELQKSTLESQVSPVPTTAAASGKQIAKYEPLQADEIASFKRALESALPTAPLSAPGQITKSGPRNPTPQPDFEDTQVVSPEERHSPLSVTQYGDLN